MSNDNYTPKGKEEIVSDLQAEFGDLDEATLEKLVNRELKHQENFGSAIKQKKSYRAKTDTLAKILKEQGIELDRDGNPVKASKPRQGQEGISQVDMSYYFAKGGTRTGLRKLQQVMAGTGKSFDDALNSDLYRAWEKENAKHIKDIKSQLPPSRGGTPIDGKETPMTDKDKKFLQALGVDPSKKKDK